MALAMLCSDPPSKVMAALSMAISVPVPIANPTSARARAGASLMLFQPMTHNWRNSCLLTLTGNAEMFLSMCDPCVLLVCRLRRLCEGQKNVRKNDKIVQLCRYIDIHLRVNVKYHWIFSSEGYESVMIKGLLRLFR
jgi:hypothetical protein